MTFDRIRDHSGREFVCGALDIAPSHAPQAQTRRAKRGQATESQKVTASARRRLGPRLGDLNRSTNRLRRNFDATDTRMETKRRVQAVVRSVKEECLSKRISFGERALQRVIVRLLQILL